MRVRVWCVCFSSLTPHSMFTNSFVVVWCVLLWWSLKIHFFTLHFLSQQLNWCNRQYLRVFNTRFAAICFCFIYNGGWKGSSGNNNKQEISTKSNHIVCVRVMCLGFFFLVCFHFFQLKIPYSVQLFQYHSGIMFCFCCCKEGTLNLGSTQHYNDKNEPNDNFTE